MPPTIVPVGSVSREVPATSIVISSICNDNCDHSCDQFPRLIHSYFCVLHAWAVKPSRPPKCFCIIPYHQLSSLRVVSLQRALCCQAQGEVKGCLIYVLAFPACSSELMQHLTFGLMANCLMDSNGTW